MHIRGKKDRKLDGLLYRLRLEDDYGIAISNIA